MSFEAEPEPALGPFRVEGEGWLLFQSTGLLTQWSCLLFTGLVTHAVTITMPTVLTDVIEQRPQPQQPVPCQIVHRQTCTFQQ